MTTKVEKLHLKTKLLKNLIEIGSIRNFFYKKHLNHSIKRQGLKNHSLNNKNGQLEIVVEGEKSKLWEVVKSAKKSSLFYRIEQISFKFTGTNQDF